MKHILVIKLPTGSTKLYESSDKDLLELNKELVVKFQPNAECIIWSENEAEVRVC